MIPQRCAGRVGVALGDERAEAVVKVHKINPRYGVKERRIQNAGVLCGARTRWQAGGLPRAKELFQRGAQFVADLAVGVARVRCLTAAGRGARQGQHRRMVGLCAHVCSGAVAERHDQVEREIGEGGKRFGGVLRKIDADLRHDGDRLRVEAMHLHAGGGDAERGVAEVARPRFGDLAAAGVAAADEEDARYFLLGTLEHG